MNDYSGRNWFGRDPLSGELVWIDDRLSRIVCKTNASLDQEHFRWRNDDGSETAATWIKAIDTDITVGPGQDVEFDTNTRLRGEILDNNSGGENNFTAQLQYNKNSTGWNDVNATSSNVRSSTSTHFADDDDTTQQLGSATYISPNAGMDEDDGLAGETNAIDYSEGTQDTVEVEHCIQFRSADLSDGDSIQLRWVRHASTTLETYTATPTVTIQTADTTLQAAIDASATVTPALTTEITMAAAVDASASLAGALTTQITMAASVDVSGNLAAELTTGGQDVGGVLEVADAGSIDLANPLNWAHPLAKDLKLFLIALPQFKGSKWYNLASPAAGAIKSGDLTNMDPATAWKNDAPPGLFRSLAFAGDNDWVDGGTGLPELPNKHTVFASVKVNSSTGEHTILYRKPTGVRDDFLFYVDTAKFKIFYNDSEGTGLTGTTSLATGEWASGGFSNDPNGSLVAYFNGKEDGSTSGITPLSTSEVRIGGNTLGGGGRWLNGSIGVLMRWNRTLSGSEHLRLFHESQAGFPNLINRIGMTAVVGAAAEADTTLAAAVDVSGTVAADLTTSITMAAGVNAATTLDADLTTQITMASGINAAADLAAALTTEITMATAVDASATLSGDLTTQITMASAVDASATLSGDLTTQITLAAGIDTATTLDADLTVETTLEAAVDASGNLAGELTTEITMATGIDATAAVAGDLTTAITFAAGINAAADVAAELATEIRMAAAVDATGNLAGELTTEITMATGIDATATVAGDLTTSITFAAGLNASAALSAGLTTAITLASAVDASASLTGALTTEITMATGLSASASIASDLTTSITFDAAVTVSLAVAADLTSTVPGIVTERFTLVGTDPTVQILVGTDPSLNVLVGTDPARATLVGN